MSAPSNTTWGNVIQGTSTNEQGKIGISVNKRVDGYKVYITVQVWYWSKYALDDVYNSFYADWNSNPTTSYGSVTLRCSDNSTSWSTSNQILIREFSKTYNKVQGSKKEYFSAKITGVESHGFSNVSSCVASWLVDSLDTHIVTYNANGGHNTPGSQTKWYGTPMVITSQVPAKTGYSFLGWGLYSTDTTVDYYPGSSYNTESDITLYAIWQPLEYQVMYDANGGSGAPNFQTKTYDVNLTLSKTIPTRKDYRFLGWNTYKTATEPLYEAGDVYTNNASVTLYAVWEITYLKPRITKYTAFRCNSEGKAQEGGTNIKITFDWETDLTGVSFRPYYKKKGEGDEKYVSTSAVQLEGTSGKVEHIIENNGVAVAFDTDTAYDIKLNLTDSNGFSTVYELVNSMFIPIDFTPGGENVSFGEPAKDTTVEKGMFRVAYTNIDLAPKNRLLFKGEVMFGQKQLWTGSSLMNETHYITLSKKISEMKNGILLVFGRDGDYNIMTFFVPKQSVVSYGRAGFTFMLCTTLFDYIGAKTLYISDTKIEGHSDNDATAKNGVSGITYHNEAFYLKYVYEV